MKRFLLAQLVLIILVLSMPTCSYANGYVAHTLTSSSHSAYAYDINDFGQIVGVIDTTEPGGQVTKSAVLWNNYNSNAQSLDNNDNYAVAQLINNSGVIAGIRYSNEGYTSTWAWNATDGLKDLYIHTADSSLWINDMNDNGSIAGILLSGDSGDSPVVLSNTGQLTHLDNTCGGVGGHANGINDAGYVAGLSLLADCDWGHASRWQVGSSAIDLGTFGGTWSNAFAINNTGQVVGSYGNDDGSFGNFVWSIDQGTIFIPTCSFLDDGIFGAIDINNNGVVLGTGQINGINTVVIWSLTDGFAIVGEGNPNAINNSGYIAGTSGGQAIVWQPVPEPSSIITLLCSITGFCMLGRFKKLK